jgi:hypothetical protein
MTAFFVPSTPRGEATNRAYEDLRSHAELITGRPPRARRIHKLSCRRDGADCETCVGELSGDRMVHAIFDLGDRYAIYMPGGQEIVTKRQTYAVFEFD